MILRRFIGEAIHRLQIHRLQVHRLQVHQQFTGNSLTGDRSCGDSEGVKKRIFDLCHLFLHKHAKEMERISSTLCFGRPVVSVETIPWMVMA